MKRLVSNLAIAVLAVLVTGGISSRADTINGAPSGLASPAETIDFSEIPLALNSSVTNQYASLGVTFSPNVYYDSYNSTQYGMPPNAVGNFTSPGVVQVDPVTINFSTTQTAAAFQMVADGTPYLFEALNGGAEVDYFTADVLYPDPALFYGFSGDTFNQIQIWQLGPGGGPYWLASDIQLSNAPAVATTPEPGSTLLFVGVGLAMLAAFGGTLRRRLALPAA